MKVRIKYYGVMRKFGTEESYDFPFSPETCCLSDILMEIIKIKGKHFKKMIYDADGQFSPYISLIVNNRVVTDDDKSVQESSIIKIIPYIAGG